MIHVPVKLTSIFSFIYSHSHIRKEELDMATSVNTLQTAIKCIGVYMYVCKKTSYKQLFFYLFFTDVMNVYQHSSTSKMEMLFYNF